jgi:hypothetical protein
MISKAAHSSSQRSFVGLATLLLPVASQDQEPGAPPPAPGFFLFCPNVQLLPSRATPVSPLSLVEILRDLTPSQQADYWTVMAQLDKT